MFHVSRMSLDSAPRRAYSAAPPHAAGMLPWSAVRVHDLTRDDLGIALVPWPVDARPERPPLPLARTRAHARQVG
jgi:hypothetical protein